MKNNISRYSKRNIIINPRVSVINNLYLKNQFNWFHSNSLIEQWAISLMRCLNAYDLNVKEYIFYHGSEFTKTVATTFESLYTVRGKPSYSLLSYSGESITSSQMRAITDSLFSLQITLEIYFRLFSIFITLTSPHSFNWLACITHLNNNNNNNSHP